MYEYVFKITYIKTMDINNSKQEKTYSKSVYGIAKHEADARQEIVRDFLQRNHWVKKLELIKRRAPK